MKEKWRIIADFEAYEVSNMGRVRRATPGKRTYVGRLLKIGTRSDGYLQVGLHRGKRCFKHVHLLVARAFLPNPKNLPEVNHLGPKNDCRAHRLEWCTKRQNELHKMRMSIGVSYVATMNKWRAYYNSQPYKKKHIGYFKTRRAALEARRAHVERLSD